MRDEPAAAAPPFGAAVQLAGSTGCFIHYLLLFGAEKQQKPLRPVTRAAACGPAAASGVHAGLPANRPRRFPHPGHKLLLRPRDIVGNRSLRLKQATNSCYLLVRRRPHKRKATSHHSYTCFSAAKSSKSRSVLSRGRLPAARSRRRATMRVCQQTIPDAFRTPAAGLFFAPRDTVGDSFPRLKQETYSYCQYPHLFFCWRILQKKATFHTHFLLLFGGEKQQKPLRPVTRAAACGPSAASGDHAGLPANRPRRFSPPGLRLLLRPRDIVGRILPQPIYKRGQSQRPFFYPSSFPPQNFSFSCFSATKSSKSRSGLSRGRLPAARLRRRATMRVCQQTVPDASRPRACGCFFALVT